MKGVSRIDCFLATVNFDKIKAVFPFLIVGLGGGGFRFLLS